MRTSKLKRIYQAATIISLIFLVNDISAEEIETLLGDWSQTTPDSTQTMVVTFEESQISMKVSINGAVIPESVQTSPVQYVELDDSWGVELLGATGEVEGAMMAILVDAETISFGAPGMPFSELKRVVTDNP